MTLNVEVTRVACNTSTGTQDITISGFGTPKAAMFICTLATADGTPVSGYMISYGAATGASNEWCVMFQDEDGQATTDRRGATESDRVIRMNNTADSTIDGDAEFNSWITDGVRIDWQTAPSAAWLLTVILFTGSDLSAHANYADLGDSLNNAVNITDPGFEPALVLSACFCQHGADSSTPATLRASFGLIHNDGGGSITQRCIGLYGSQGSGTSGADGRITATYGIMEIDSDSLLDWGGEFGSFDSSGFTVTTRIAGGNNTAMFYLALGLGTFSGWVGTVDTPTSTGNDSQSGPNFLPQFVFSIMSMMEAVDTAYHDDALAGSYGFSAFSDSTEYANSVQTENGVATSNTQSLSDDTAVELPDDDGSTGLTAAFTSFDATGWNWNFSAVEANAKKFFSMAFGGEATDVITQHRRQHVMGPF
jgi:hypothetical protein